MEITTKLAFHDHVYWFKDDQMYWLKFTLSYRNILLLSLKVQLEKTVWKPFLLFFLVRKNPFF